MQKTQATVASLPRWYESRSGVFALIYATGLLCGWAVCAATGHGYVPAFRAIAQGYGAGSTIAAAAALGCIALAVAIRLWGSSYLSEERVWSKDARIDSLVIAGPFRYCRHPLYAANIVLALGLGSLAPLWGWIFIVIAHLFFVCALIGREERLLAARYKAEYAEYRRRVPALVPRFLPVPQSGADVRPAWHQGLRSESFSLFIIAGVASFFVVPRYGWWIFAGAYVVGVIVQRRIER